MFETKRKKEKIAKQATKGPGKEGDFPAFEDLPDLSGGVEKTLKAATKVVKEEEQRQESSRCGCW